MFLAKCLTALLLAINVCFFFYVGTCHANPGIRVQITQKGLNYANDIALTKMYDELQNYDFPDIYKGGSSAYRLYNIRASRVSKPSGQAVFVPGQGLEWTLKIEGYHLSGYLWHAQRVLWFTIRNTFSLSMYVSSVELKLTLQATKAYNGGLTLKASSCRSYVDVKVSSSNFIMQIILKFLRKRINRIIENKLCESSTRIINNDVSRDLADFPVAQQIGHGYFFDYGFVSNPVFNSNYMQTNHKAAILDRNKNGWFPFAPPQLQQLNENKNMIYFIISEYVLNTWLYTVYRDNQLSLKVNSNMVESESDRSIFQTVCPNHICIGTFFPKIAKMYPNSKMEIHFTTYENPIVHIKPNHVQLTVPARAEMIVVQANGSYATILKAELALFSEVQTKISGVNIMFTVTKTIFNVRKVHGVTFANFSVAEVKSALEVFVKSAESSLPGKQFPLVVPPNTMLVNPSLRVVQNGIIVASDINIQSI